MATMTPEMQQWLAALPPQVQKDLMGGNTTTRYKAYIKLMQEAGQNAQKNDPEFQEWQAAARMYGPQDQDQAPPMPPAVAKRMQDAVFAAIGPAVADYNVAAADVSEQNKKSITSRIGSALKFAVPALVGGAGLVATGLLGSAAQGFVGGGSLGGSGVSAGAISGAAGLPELGLASQTGLGTGLGGAGTITGGSGPLLSTGLGGTGSGLGVAGAAAPALGGGSAVAGSSLLSGLAGLADYAPLISAGLGVANSALGGPDMPSTPNYSALLDKQTVAQNALYDKLLKDSRVNQIGPDGSQTWSKDANGQWTLTNSLNNSQQGLYDTQQGMSQALLNNAQSGLQGPVDVSNIPGMNYGTTDANGMPNYNQTVADAYYSQGTRYLDPQITQDQRALESRLGAQGFVPGTPAYNQAMENFMDAKNRSYGSVRDFATTQGFTTGLQNAQFGNQARQQSISEALMLRNQPLNELNAFRSGSQVNAPQGNAQYQTPNQSAPDVMGTAQNSYNANLGQYNAGVAQNNQTTNSLFGLAGTLSNGKYNLFTGMGK